MPESNTAGTRRKNPPTFRHLPINRAATLKKAWVQKTKIKSKWKAEKRKQGLASASKLELPVYEDEGRDKSPENNDINASEADSDASQEPAHEAKASAGASKQSRPQASVMHPSRAHIHPTLPVKQLPSAKRAVNDSNNARPVKRQRTSKSEEAAEPLSLRELTKQAYSKETLHTYKADPFKKHRKSDHEGLKGRSATTGRGQPNMKLRMNAMLAKIKQDFA